MAKKMCESCGMPLKAGVCGTRKNGEPSQHYCNKCYKGGEFIGKECTPEEMIEYSINGMTKAGWPKFLAILLTKNIPKLPRWQQEDTSKPVEE